MLVLSRNLNERIYLKIPASTESRLITVVLCSVNNTGSVRLGFEAPKEVKIFRDDIQDLEPKS